MDEAMVAEGADDSSSEMAKEPTGRMRAFTFGEPTPVLDVRKTILDMLGCSLSGDYYLPPVSMDGLARVFFASPHHSSAIELKRDMLLADLRPSPLLSARQFDGFVIDQLTFGNSYLQAVPGRLGGVAHYERVLAQYVRRMKEPERYLMLMPGSALGEKAGNHKFEPGEIVHLKSATLSQEVYGLPSYLGALQSALLNENATLFRRKYYLNGSHAGFILHMEGEFNDDDVDEVREALRQARGPGNFRNLLLHSVGGSKGSVSLIPISEVAAKDEFLGIKNTTRDDVLAAHRVFPQLVAVVPQNTGGFGSMAEAKEAFKELVIEPLKTRLEMVNEEAGEQLILFRSRPMW